MSEKDDLIAEAKQKAKGLRRWSWFFKANQVLLVPFWVLSPEPPIQRAMFVYLAAVSIHALVKTYDAEAEAADAKAAGYENP